MRGTPGTCNKQIKTKHMYNETNLHKFNIYLDVNTQNFTAQNMPLMQITFYHVYKVTTTYRIVTINIAK
jgi:hypothetical protein